YSVSALWFASVHNPYHRAAKNQEAQHQQRDHPGRIGHIPVENRCSRVGEEGRFCGVVVGVFGPSCPSHCVIIGDRYTAVGGVPASREATAGNLAGECQTAPCLPAYGQATERETASC